MCRGKRSQFFSAIACGEGPFFYVISACNSIKISRFRKGTILLERSLKLISSNFFEFIICYVWWMCIHTGTNYALLLADLFFYSYEADFIHGPLKKNQKK